MEECLGREPGVRKGDGRRKKGEEEELGPLLTPKTQRPRPGLITPGLMTGIRAGCI